MAEEESNEKNVPKWLLTIRNIAFVVIGLLTAWNTYRTGATKEELDIQAKKMDQTIKQKEFENELRFKVFDEVKKALATPDSNMQEVVRVMVEQILADDTSFQQKMQTVLLASNNTKKSVKEAMRNTEQYQQEQKELEQHVLVQKRPETTVQLKAPSATPVTASVKENFRIDVFYLEDIISESKGRAEQIQKLLIKKYPTYDVRLRLLPKSINAREGYRIDSNQIRYEASESAIAKEVHDLIANNAMFPHEKPIMHQISFPTPNYISVFVRNM